MIWFCFCQECNFERIYFYSSTEISWKVISMYWKSYVSRGMSEWTLISGSHPHWNIRNHSWDGPHIHIMPLHHWSGLVHSFYTSNYTISLVLTQPLPISPHSIQNHGKNQGTWLFIDMSRCALYIPESGLWAEGLPPGSTFRAGPSPFRYSVAVAARGPSALPTFCCSCD